MSRRAEVELAIQHFETWEWDGVTWRQVTTANVPTTNKFVGLAYDPRRERMVCQGRVVGSTVIGDVLDYDGFDRAQRPLVASPAVAGHTDGCFDARVGRILNFGGGSTKNRSVTLAVTDSYGPVHDATGNAFGADCAGSAGLPTLDCGALPRLGSNSMVDLSSATAEQHPRRSASGGTGTVSCPRHRAAAGIDAPDRPAARMPTTQCRGAPGASIRPGRRWTSGPSPGRPDRSCWNAGARGPRRSPPLCAHPGRRHHLALPRLPRSRTKVDRCRSSSVTEPPRGSFSPPCCP
jgi:hypothetical protein